MGLDIKTPDGKAGYFDTNAFLQEQAPGSSVTDYNPQAGVLQFKTADGKPGSFNVKQMLADQNVQVTGHKEFNTPTQAVDQSPLDWKERFELGYLTRESSDFQKLITGVKTLVGGQSPNPAENDKTLAANEQRAIGQLKKRYEDATVANGELVVKQNGVWKKVDSSSDTIGQDAAQFLGNTGLNLLGAVAGGTLGAQAGAAAGPAGAAIGGTIGAVVGSMAGEVMEEATAVGIVGGHVDVPSAARDLMTETMLGMGGEIMGSATGKAINKIVGSTPEEVAKIQAVQTEAKVLSGMKEVASTADSKVKDTISQVYNKLNPSLSVDPLREAIDSPENMTQAWKYSREAANLPKDAPNPMLRDMADNIQGGLEGVQKAATEDFGKVLNKIRNSVSEDFKIDLDQHITDLKAASMDAPRDKRAYFNVLENEATDLKTALVKQGDDPVINGKKAFNFAQRQYEIISKKLADVGAYDKAASPSSGDRLLFNSMEKIKAYLDDKRLFAAEHADLSDEFSDIKKTYGQVKDNLEAIWGKSFSNKRDLTFAQNVSKGAVDPNVKEAFAELHDLYPSVGLQDLLNDNKLKQAGIEMGKSFFRMEGIKPLGVVTGATIPKAAALQARGLAAGSELTANTVAKAMPAARSGARSLMGMAYTSNFVRGLGQAEARGLLQNADAFNQFIGTASKMINNMSTIDESAVTDQAIKAAAPPIQGGP